MAAMRKAAAPSKGKLDRAGFDQVMELTPDATGIQCTEGIVGGVDGWWCRPEGVPEKAALLYLHGGAYVVGSARPYTRLAGQIAARAHVPTFVAEYRLAPEHGFPAAVEDALSVYRGLVAEGFSRIALVGDSAGGGLALVLLALAAEEARSGSSPQPRGAAVMSPWTDLLFTGPSLENNSEVDPVLTREALAEAAQQYLGGHDARDPLASPLFGDLSGLPPIRLHVGSDEILLDDSLRYAARFTNEDLSSELHVWDGMSHVFPASVGTLAASGMALDNIGEFLRQQLDRDLGATQ